MKYHLIFVCLLGLSLSTPGAQNQGWEELLKKGKQAAFGLETARFHEIEQQLEPFRAKESSAPLLAGIQLNKGYHTYFRRRIDTAHVYFAHAVKLAEVKGDLIFMEALGMEIWTFILRGIRETYTDEEKSYLITLLNTYGQHAETHRLPGYHGVHAFFVYLVDRYFKINEEVSKASPLNLFEIQQLMEVNLSQIRFFFAALANTLGGCAYNSQQYDKAVYYWRLSAQRFEQINCQSLLAKLYNNIAIAYKNAGRTDSSLYFMEKSFDMYEAKGIHESISLGNLMSTYLAQNDDEKYKLYQRKAQQWLIQGYALTPRDSFQLLSRIADTYLHEKKLLEAKRHYLAALKLKDRFTMEVNLEKHLFKQLSGIAKTRKHQDEALYYYERYHLADSIYVHNEMQENFLKVERDYAAKRKDQEIELLKEVEKIQQIEARQQRILNYSLSGGAILLAIILINEYRNRQRQRKTNTIISNYNVEIETRNKALEEANTLLETANREKDLLMDVVAHDLQSPIDSMIGFSRLMMLPNTSETERKLQQKSIEEEYEKSQQLIRSMLDLHIWEQGKCPIEPRPIEVNVFLSHLVSRFELQAIEKGIRFQFERKGQLVVHSDLAALSRVINNLLSNAIKFSPANSTVLIKSFQEDDYACISVEDQGPGFTENDKKKVFGKFQKLSAKPTGGEPSTGLGLAIVKMLVDLLEGEIHLESRYQQGSVFTVKIKKTTAFANISFSNSVVR